MAELRGSCALISFGIFVYLAFQTSRFRKEFKEGIRGDRTLSDEFVKKWDKRLSKNIILIVIATLFGMVAVLITDIK